MKYFIKTFGIITNKKQESALILGIVPNKLPLQ